VGDGWLENLLSPFSADEKIAVTQSKLLSYQEPQYIDSAGGYIDLLGNAMERGCFYSHYERDNGQYDRVQEIFSGCAAALAVKKVIFNEVGGFDDDFFILLEDVDLCWRIRLGGYKIVLAPHSVVFHHRGIARRSLSSKNQNVSSFHLYKNQVLMLLKNYGRIMLCIISPFVLMIYLLRLFRMRPAFEAMKWNVKSLHKTLQKRKQIQKNIRKVHDWKIIKHMDKMPLRIQYLLRRLGLIQT
jgi:GT2 family glycosyltransferase